MLSRGPQQGVVVRYMGKPAVRPLSVQHGMGWAHVQPTAAQQMATPGIWDQHGCDQKRGIASLRNAPMPFFFWGGHGRQSEPPLPPGMKVLSPTPTMNIGDVLGFRSFVGHDPHSFWSWSTCSTPFCQLEFAGFRQPRFPKSSGKACLGMYQSGEKNAHQQPAMTDSTSFATFERL